MQLPPQECVTSVPPSAAARRSGASCARVSRFKLSFLAIFFIPGSFDQAGSVPRSPRVRGRSSAVRRSGIIAMVPLSLLATVRWRSSCATRNKTTCRASRSPPPVFHRTALRPPPEAQAGRCYHPAVSALDSEEPSSAPGGASSSVAPSGLHGSSAPGSAPRWLEHLPLLWIGLALLAFALTAPIRRLGDAADYVMATESLLYDHDLRYTPEDLARHLRLKPIDFDSPAGLHTRPGRGGKQYLGAHHSFYYSLAALPFYAAFGYRGFLLFNALAFWIFTLCLYRHLRTWNGMGVSWAWLLMALVFSASWTYVAWIHTEVFYMSLVGLFLFAWRRGRILWAAAALGVVAAAQPTLSLLGIPFLLLVWLERRRIGLLVGMGGVILLAAAPQVLYN